MSGHSHWANIQHKKGTVDDRARPSLEQAQPSHHGRVRNGGGDPIMNIRLRVAIDDARMLTAVLAVLTAVFTVAQVRHLPPWSRSPARPP